MSFQHFVNRNPVNACRLHRNGGYSETDQPVGYALEIGSEGLEGLNGLFGEVYGNGNNMKARANIDACRTVMDNG